MRGDEVARARRRRTSPERRGQAPRRPPPRQRPRAPRPPARRSARRGRRAGSPEARSTERSGRMSVGSGFIAARTTSGLAVRDSALEAAGSVRRALEAGLDLVVRLRAAEPREREALPHLDTLHRLGAHQRGASRASSRSSFVGVRAEPRRDAVCDDLDDAAERVAIRCAPSSVARCQPSSDDSPPISSTRPSTTTPISASSAFATAPAATWAAVCRALARSSALRMSSWPNLSAPARSACPGRGSVTARRALARRLALGRPGAHPPRPVRVVAVADDERERRAERRAVAKAGEHLDLVLLHLLARAPAVALAAAGEIALDRGPGRARGPREGRSGSPRAQVRGTLLRSRARASRGEA